MSPPFLRYSPPGPVAARYQASQARVRAIMGPIGSGKTGGSLMNFLHVGMGQAPNPRDGVRRTRFAVVRKTYRDLERTVVRSWLEWVPKELGEWVGGAGGQPATHRLKFQVPDGTTVESEVLFLAIGEASAEQVMRGFEVTRFYLNEADQLERDVLLYADSRVGRYPRVEADIGFAGATFPGVDLDFNSPDTDSWLYEMFVENIPATWEFFRQPGGMLKVGGRYVLNPAAENLRNLLDGYYDAQIAGKPEWWIRRMVLNEFGFSRDGQPVYPEYNDTLHVAPLPLAPLDAPLVIGGDAGLTPAALITQMTPFGQLRLLDEVVAPPGGMGARAFGAMLNQVLREKYRGLTCVGWGDPAATARASTDEQTWLQVMQAVTGFVWRPAPTNKLLMRLEAVRQPLTRLIDGEPGLLMSPTCKVTRRGFNSGYRFRRVQVGGGDRFADEPEKNDYSHPHDALQYAALGHGLHIDVLGRREQGNAARRQTHADDGNRHPGGSYAPPSAGRQSHADSD